MTPRVSSPIWTAAKGLLALVGIPFAALTVTAGVVGAIEPGWQDGTDCRARDAAMGVIGIGGLLVGMSVAAGVWQRRIRSVEADAEVVIRNDIIRSDSFVAGLFWVAIVLGFIAIPAIVTGKLGVLAITLPILVLPAWLLRMASVGIWTRGDELYVRNPYRTWRLRRQEIRSIDVGSPEPGKRRSKEVPFVETEAGERIVLVAAVHRGPFMRLERAEADDAVRRLRAWCSSGDT